MPGLDGYELAFEVQSDAKLAGAYIILHTSLSSEISVERAHQVGAHEALTKFEANELIQATLRGAEHHDSLPVDPDGEKPGFAVAFSVPVTPRTQHADRKPLPRPWWARNPHLQTILPKWLRRQPARFVAERFELADGDFVDPPGAARSAGMSTLIVLFHGLEGSIHPTMPRDCLPTCNVRATRRC